MAAADDSSEAAAGAELWRLVPRLEKRRRAKKARAWPKGGKDLSLEEFWEDFRRIFQFFRGVLGGFLDNSRLLLDVFRIF